jgi:hypothetical protein
MSYFYVGRITNLSPAFVYEQIAEFQKKYSISDDDQLWIVIDRDRWAIKAIKLIAQYCAQNQNLNFCVSNPCFELWLLLHKLDVVGCCTAEEQLLILNNKKIAKAKDTYIKNLLRKTLICYSESHYDAAGLLETVDLAINRAKDLDTIPESRWPEQLGTRVYRLVESILNLNI